MSSPVESILNELPVDQIAAQIGLSPDEAKPAIRDAVSSVLAGIDANAADPAGSASLAEALPQHEDSLPADGLTLDAIDTGDGGKIVEHVFGDKTGQVAEALGSREAAAGKSQIEKLLPIVAPVVMAYLAKQVLGGKKTGTSGGGGLGDVLGSILGGAAKGGGGGLGDVLGSILGGGRR